LVRTEAKRETHLAETQGKTGGTSNGVLTQEKKAEPKAKKEVAKKSIETKTYPEIDLNGIGSVDELETLELDHLKAELQRRGLKCGGMASERATRLWSVRGLKPAQYPKNIRAK